MNQIKTAIPGTPRKHRVGGVGLQSTQFANTTACKGRKPKLYGFFNDRAKPSMCKVVRFNPDGSEAGRLFQKSR